MKSTYLRFYLATVGTFLVALASCLIIVGSSSHNLKIDVIEGSLRPGLHLARDRLLRVPSRDMARVLVELQPIFAEPIELISAEQLSQAAHDRLASGREVAFWMQDWDPWTQDWDNGYAVIALSDGWFLRQGPFVEDVYDSWSPNMHWVLAFLAVLVLCGLAVSLSLHPIIAHMKRLQAAALAVGEGNHHARVAERGDAYQRAVARAFNRMVGRLTTAVAARTELLRAVSHELRTPLARLRFRIELLQEADDDEARMRHAAALDRDVSALDELVEELLTHARLEDGHHLQRVRMDVFSAVEQIVERRRVPKVHDHVEVTIDADSALRVAADRRLFARAVGNVLENALRFAQQEVRMEVRAHGVDMVVIAVLDDGPGIAPALRERIFLPFETSAETDAVAQSPNRGTGGGNDDSGESGGGESRAAGEGHAGIGLGLAIVRGVLQAHGGRVEAGESPAGGGAIYMYWPRASMED